MRTELLLQAKQRTAGHLPIADALVSGVSISCVALFGCAPIKMFVGCVGFSFGLVDGAFDMLGRTVDCV